MPRAGETINNPFSGETITFVRTAADTGGAAVELLFDVTPGGAPAAAHVHPVQTETFAVHEGRCRVVVDGVERDLGPGDVAAVPPGTPHVWTALTDVRMTVTLEPALTADVFFEDYCALAHDGRVDGHGMPTPLHMAVLADDHRDVVYLAGPPAALQRVLFRVLGAVGRALGRRASAPAPVVSAPSPRGDRASGAAAAGEGRTGPGSLPRPRAGQARS